MVVAFAALVLGAAPAAASDADLRDLNAVRAASHVPAAVEQQTGPLKTAAEALAKQADDENLSPSDFSLDPAVDSYCRCEIHEESGDWLSFDGLYRRLGGSGLATAWTFPPGSLAAGIRRLPASSIAVAHPWMNEAAFSRTPSGLIVVALAAARAGSVWRAPVIARPDAAQHGSLPWILLPAAARGRATVAVRKPYGFQYVMRPRRVFADRGERSGEPVRGVGGAWLASLADERLQVPLALAWGATYRVASRGGRAEFKARAMPASQRRATWRFVNLRRRDRALFLSVVRHANRQVRRMFSIIDGVTRVSVMGGKCPGSWAFLDQRGGYSVGVCRGELYDRSGRAGTVLYLLGLTLSQSGLTASDDRAFARLFSHSRRWRRCFPAWIGCTFPANVFAAQFAYFASASSRFSIPRLINRRQFGRLLAQRWLPKPNPPTS